MPGKQDLLGRAHGLYCYNVPSGSQLRIGRYISQKNKIMTISIKERKHITDEKLYQYAIILNSCY